MIKLKKVRKKIITGIIYALDVHGILNRA